MKKTLVFLLITTLFFGCGKEEGNVVAPAKKINKTVVDTQLTSGLNYIVSLTGVTVVPCDMTQYYEFKQGGALSARNNGAANCNSGWEGSYKIFENENGVFFETVGQIVYTDSYTKKHTFRVVSIQNGVLKGAETLYEGTSYQKELVIELTHDGTPR